MLCDKLLLDSITSFSGDEDVDDEELLDELEFAVPTTGVDNNEEEEEEEEVEETPLLMERCWEV